MADLAAIVLAGGRATRMGGGDKCLLPLGQGRIIDHVLARLGPQAAHIAISANGDPVRFGDLNLPVLGDPLADFPGPLAGVLAGMEWAAGLGMSHLLSVAADTPFFPRDLATTLAAARLHPGQIVIAASREADNRLVRQPTFGFWPTTLRDDLHSSLQGGVRKIVLWAERHPHLFADVGPSEYFFNINTPEDLNTAAAMLESAS